MKKIILLILCLVLMLAGCQNLVKAEPYYTETNDSVVLSTKYKYSFTDEGIVRCVWTNNSDIAYSFHDVFELHVLGDDGEWYLVSNGDEVSFNTNYSHGIDPQSESNAKYTISLYTDELKSGKTYRISTYFYDDDKNYYQAFAEFTCDDELAENELKESSDGLFSHRKDPSAEGSFKVIEDNKNS